MSTFAKPLAAAVAIVLTAGLASAGEKGAEHPYIVWDAQQLAAIGKRVQAGGEDIKKQLAKTLGKAGSRNRAFANLFRYKVLGDEKARDSEKKYLLGFIGKTPDNCPVKRAHNDNSMMAVRYDVLYEDLTADERKKIEDTFRVFIRHQLNDKKRYTRTSWLPNMQWPRPMAAHLMAVALGDEELIRKLHNSNGGWKWYFDEYIADGQFYMEEFGKHYSMIGVMLLYCNGLDRLGLGELGFDYKGKGGATMRSYVDSIIAVGYPRISIGTDRYHYPKVTMGDASGCPRSLKPEKNQPSTGYHYMFQHAIVNGYLPDGRGGDAYWTGKNMNGRDYRNVKVQKMLAPLWFEFAHARWPKGGYDYFLAQMRTPEHKKYYPTLYFNLSPIDPQKVTAPPVKSYVAPERGFVMLRANETSDYWESDDPAVAMNLALYYVHFVRDYFSILGYYAYQRPIYMNRNVSQGYATGDPWTGWGRGKCTVIVDGDLMNSHGEIRPRHHFGRLAKFVAARSDRRWSTGDPDGGSHDLGKPEEKIAGRRIDETRALVLTKEYMFDVASLTGRREHTYDWQVHTLGSHQPETPKAWKPTDELDGGKLYARSSGRLSRRHDLQQTVKHTPGEKPWTFRALQTCQLDDVSESVLGREWYAQGVGVRVMMLGQADTEVFVGKTPTHSEPKGWDEPEIGGVSLIARRKAKSATFIALHEPFEGGLGKHRVESFQRIAGDDHAFVAKVEGADGSGIDDRVLLAVGDKAGRQTMLRGGGETYTFTGYAFVRIGEKKIVVEGDLAGIWIPVKGRPTLIINGKEVEATIGSGKLIWGDVGGDR